MTTNYRRALATAVHCDLVDESPRELVKQLDALGLIAPDLPEPTVKDSVPMWELNRWIKYVYSHNETIIAGVEEGYYSTLDLDEAENLALALLAAVKHQKENQND